MSVPTVEVLLLCWRDTDHPQGGGSERYLERVGAELARRGLRVTLLTARYPGSARREYRDGVQVIRAGGRLTVYPRTFATLVAARVGRGRLRGRRPDVVVDTQNGVPFFAALTGLAPTVLLVHHCHREQWPVAGPVLARIGWWIESWLSPRVHRNTRYVTVSGPSAAELVTLGVAAENIAVVRNGLDPLPGGVDAASRWSSGVETTRPDEHAFPNPEPRLVVLSRLVPHKQVEHALAAVAGLRDRGIVVHLDVVGGGWWAQALTEEAARLGIDGQVTFHGHVDERRKHQLLAAADLHLMPSRKEGWGLAVIEAAQHGVPTIGYRASSGLTDSIVDGSTGLLVDDAVGLTEAAAALLADRDRLTALGEAARERSRRYSWELTADGFAAVFAELLALGRDVPSPPPHARHETDDEAAEPDGVRGQ
ncbi:glycosyltransferase family 4 protein [Gordonia sp. FQ]|uniref:glycosyltransferase family 4 protein n=1 Tax=Gordonia sp. FQ TaxID=3446634 RepID=UPI003F868AA8